jgi:hypothetical protein
MTSDTTLIPAAPDTLPHAEMGKLTLENWTNQAIDYRRDLYVGDQEMLVRAREAERREIETETGFDCLDAAVYAITNPLHPREAVSAEKCVRLREQKARIGKVEVEYLHGSRQLELAREADISTVKTFAKILELGLLRGAPPTAEGQIAVPAVDAVRSITRNLDYPAMQLLANNGLYAAERLGEITRINERLAKHFSGEPSQTPAESGAEYNPALDAIELEAKTYQVALVLSSQFENYGVVCLPDAFYSDAARFLESVGRQKFAEKCLAAEEPTREKPDVPTDFEAFVLDSFYEATRTLANSGSDVAPSVKWKVGAKAAASYSALCSEVADVLEQSEPNRIYAENVLGA